MDGKMPEIVEEAPKAEVPEDVATLYAWANLEGAPYQDFSAARREYRAQVRARAAEGHRHVSPRAEFADPGRGAVLREAAGVDRTRLALEAAAARLRAAGQGDGATDVKPALPSRGTGSGAESMLPQRFPQRRSARAMMPHATLEGEAPTPAMEVAAGPGEGPAKESMPTQETGTGKQATLQGGLARHGDAAVMPRSNGGVSPKSEAGVSRAEPEGVAPIPAWLHGASREAEPAPSARAVPESSPVSDTLQHTRERVASRWYALRGVFDPTAPEMEPTQAHVRAGGNAVLVVFSLAGGVGKTSLTASLGRALSSSGERVLMVDVATHGLLPFYFGAHESRAGVVRKFLPPAGSVDAPISLLSHDLASRMGTESAGNESLAMELARKSREFERVLVDLSPAAPATLRELVRTGATVLVPVAPDMNSVITLGAVEKFFADLTDGAGLPVQPRYLLTQFDPALPLHLDVREVIRQQLGDRLLPFAIRRSPAVAEALAEGMTVIDYAPGSGVAADYRDVANWARAVAAAPASTLRPGRWSER